MVGATLIFLASHCESLRSRSKLTKVGNFRGTICTVEEEDYLLRRINGIEQPVITRANEARKAMMAVAVEMIRGLHWADFETLADLIFARSGWQR